MPVADAGACHALPDAARAAAIASCPCPIALRSRVARAANGSRHARPAAPKSAVLPARRRLAGRFVGMLGRQRVVDQYAGARGTPKRAAVPSRPGAAEEVRPAASWPLHSRMRIRRWAKQDSPPLGARVPRDPTAPSPTLCQDSNILKYQIAQAGVCEVSVPASGQCASSIANADGASACGSRSQRSCRVRGAGATRGTPLERAKGSRLPR